MTSFPRLASAGSRHPCEPLRPLVSPAWLAVAPDPARTTPPRRDAERRSYAAHFHGVCGGYL